MWTEEEIRHALHADRVVPLGVANSHGPLGLEQLAAAVAANPNAGSPNRVRRPIELPVQTWQKLHALTARTSKAGSLL